MSGRGGGGSLYFAVKKRWLFEFSLPLSLLFTHPPLSLVTGAGGAEAERGHAF
jgi:hypothetical protein